MRSERPKWRPSLGQVTLGVLIMVVMLPLVGLFFFRVLENQLIRETESELIAQTAVLAQVFAQLAEKEGLALGPFLPADAKPDKTRAFDPILPSLDLASSDLLPTRPDAKGAPAISKRARAVGAALTELGRETQRTTLAGFRFLDATGTVIGGRGEVGLSFAHVREVSRALSGHYDSAIRSRIRDKPTPPLYSISRGTSIRVFVAMPVVVGQRVAGVVYASRTPNNIVKYFYAERAKLITAGLIIFAVLLILGAFFIRLINKPVADLIAWTGEISAGKRPETPPKIRHGTREIAQLADSFGEMAEGLHTRSDYIATFAAHVSHELKSPLTTIQGAAELLRDADMKAPDRERFLDAISGDAGRLTLLLDRLRDLARAQTRVEAGRTRLCDIAPDLGASHSTVRVEVLGAVETPLAISAENLWILLAHLIDNSAEHGAHVVTLTVMQGDPVRLMVEDDGPGISPGNRARIFDPFFTTKRDKGGTGVGLEIVKSLLLTHKGSIRLVDTGTEAGTCFEILLPLATPKTSHLPK